MAVCAAGAAGVGVRVPRSCSTGPSLGCTDWHQSVGLAGRANWVMVETTSMANAVSLVQGFRLRGNGVPAQTEAEAFGKRIENDVLHILRRVGRRVQNSASLQEPQSGNSRDQGACMQAHKVGGGARVCRTAHLPSLGCTVSATTGRWIGFQSPNNSLKVVKSSAEAPGPERQHQPGRHV